MQADMALAWRSRRLTHQAVQTPTLPVTAWMANYAPKQAASVTPLKALQTQRGVSDLAVAVQGRFRTAPGWPPAAHNVRPQHRLTTLGPDYPHHHCHVAAGPVRWQGDSSPLRSKVSALPSTWSAGTEQPRPLTTGADLHSWHPGGTALPASGTKADDTSEFGMVSASAVKPYVRKERTLPLLLLVQLRPRAPAHSAVVLLRLPLPLRPTPTTTTTTTTTTYHYGYDYDYDYDYSPLLPPPN